MGIPLRSIAAILLALLGLIALLLIMTDGLSLTAGAGLLALVLVGLAGLQAIDGWRAEQGQEGLDLRLRRDVGRIGNLLQQLSDDIQSAFHRIDDLDHRLRTYQEDQRNELVEEMRVIENLLARIANKGTEKAKRISFGAQTEEPEQERPAEMAKGRASLLEEFADEDAPQHTLSMDMVQEALQENRIDLYLQQIVSLPQRKHRFYESYSMLRDADGNVYGPSQYMGPAARAGVMSDIDNLLLFRCVQLVRRLKERNKHVQIFINISANSMQDEDFFHQFTDFMEMNVELSDVLIFEFSQEAVDRCGVQQWGSLSRLAQFGFVFSMDQVTSLDLDFAAMARHKFRFLKVSADLLVETGNSMENQAGAQIHPADLKEILRRNGIDLIAEGIDSEKQVVDVLDFELDYGQGLLFGEPRPSRDNVPPVPADSP